MCMINLGVNTMDLQTQVLQELQRRSATNTEHSTRSFAHIKATDCERLTTFGHAPSSS